MERGLQVGDLGGPTTVYYRIRLRNAPSVATIPGCSLVAEPSSPSFGCTVNVPVKASWDMDTWDITIQHLLQVAADFHRKQCHCGLLDLQEFTRDVKFHSPYLLYGPGLAKQEREPEGSNDVSMENPVKQEGLYTPKPTPTRTADNPRFHLLVTLAPSQPATRARRRSPGPNIPVSGSASTSPSPDSSKPGLPFIQREKSANGVWYTPQMKPRYSDSFLDDSAGPFNEELLRLPRFILDQLRPGELGVINNPHFPRYGSFFVSVLMRLATRKCNRSEWEHIRKAFRLTELQLESASVTYPFQLSFDDRWVDNPASHLRTQLLIFLGSYENSLEPRDRPSGEEFLRIRDIQDPEQLLTRILKLLGKRNHLMLVGAVFPDCWLELFTKTGYQHTRQDNATFFAKIARIFKETPQAWIISIASCSLVNYFALPSVLPCIDMSRQELILRGLGFSKDQVRDLFAAFPAGDSTESQLQPLKTAAATLLTRSYKMSVRPIGWDEEESLDMFPIPIVVRILGAFQTNKPASIREELSSLQSIPSYPSSLWEAGETISRAADPFDRRMLHLLLKPELPGAWCNGRIDTNFGPEDGPALANKVAETHDSVDRLILNRLFLIRYLYSMGLLHIAHVASKDQSIVRFVNESVKHKMAQSFHFRFSTHEHGFHATLNDRKTTIESWFKQNLDDRFALMSWAQFEYASEDWFMGEVERLLLRDVEAGHRNASPPIREYHLSADDAQRGDVLLVADSREFEQNSGTLASSTTTIFEGKAAGLRALYEGTHGRTLPQGTTLGPEVAFKLKNFRKHLDEIEPVLARWCSSLLQGFVSGGKVEPEALGRAVAEAAGRITPKWNGSTGALVGDVNDPEQLHFVVYTDGRRIPIRYMILRSFQQALQNADKLAAGRLKHPFFKTIKKTADNSVDYPRAHDIQPLTMSLIGCKAFIQTLPLVKTDKVFIYTGPARQ
ncbi:hypothetical protein FB45DRAFT_1025230 [Roridomyces roridus]|uniref:Uncharacterized protein n=1 Tax=Roridomyces roridus TaxID=1738132 RepID=A0AAD7FTL3_9AGAR|nr:hypothetical protein FB45DRAFT_1025230 [Roridomyces roridus]